MKLRRIDLAVNTAAIAVIIWILFPFYTMLKMAFSTIDAIYTISLFPTEISVKPFIDVVTGSFYLTRSFWLQAWNSLVIAFGTIAMVISISLLGGYAIGKIKFTLKSHFATIAMLTYLFPQAFIALPIFVVMQEWGLINSYVGIILVQTAFSAPFSIFIVADYATSIPTEIEESARVDGASRLQLFTKIFLPLSTPIIITLSIYNFLVSWDSYLMPLLLLHSEKLYTLPLAIGYFFTIDMVEWNIFMAFGLIYAIPPLIFYFLFKRFIVGGLMRGALKY